MQYVCQSTCNYILSICRPINSGGRKLNLITINQPIYKYEFTKKPLDIEVVQIKYKIIISCWGNNITEKNKVLVTIWDII
jgi:hypothetical protein